MKNAKSLAITLSALALFGLALFGLAQFTPLAQAQNDSNNSTLHGSPIGPPVPSPYLPLEPEEPEENLLKDCKWAWMISSANQTCNSMRIAEVENTSQCTIDVDCWLPCGDDSPWWCSFAPSWVSLNYQGDADEIRRLHHCDGNLKLDGC